MAKDSILISTIACHNPIVLLNERMTAANCKLDSMVDARHGLWSVHL